jgi:hypothetical protein
MRRLVERLAILAALALIPGPALAGNFPTRQGESGLLDVPDAELIPRNTALLGFEFGFDHAPGSPDRVGPLPLSLGVGLGRLEWAVSARESGYPGDPRPAPILFGTAVKLGILAPAGLRPGIAIDGYLDRINDGGVGGGRLILSTAAIGPFRASGLAGYEKQPTGSSGLTAGLAASVRHQSGVEAVVEGMKTPRGSLASAALRYDLNQRVGVGLVGSYLPDSKEFRIALAFGFRAAPIQRAVVVTPAPAVEPKAAEPEAEPVLAFGERPLFKLRVRSSDPSRPGEPRHTQYAPYTASSPTGASPAPPSRAAAPSADGVLAAQLRDQELLAEARLKRLRATDDSLNADEGHLDADARTIDERERVLTARAGQVDARERRIVVRGAPTDQQRQLESQEAQLGEAERQLVAQERGFNPTREAALRTERDAQARERSERTGIDRLLARAEAEKTKARQGELRRQALAARQRMLDVMESRLLARGMRLDVATRQLRARRERVDTWQRRLDLRAERLDLLERRAAEQQRAAAAAKPGVPLPPAAKDKAVFVVVVKSPTAIMKAAGGTAGAGKAGGAALHPGVVVGKAVAAAAVIDFTSPASKLSDLDRESIDGVARLAAREDCEVLVWARAKDPTLMNEANRRAQEVKALIVSLAGLTPNQVVTRITTRPDAQGVDLVVSALRDVGKPRAEADGGGEIAAGDRLARGETAKRQVRDAVVAVQPAIAQCASEKMIRRGLVRAEGTLKLTVNPAGRITSVQAGAGDLEGGQLDACLKAASTAWQFPTADTEYVVDVPITVVGAGAKP